MGFIIGGGRDGDRDEIERNERTAFFLHYLFSTSSWDSCNSAGWDEEKREEKMRREVEVGKIKKERKRGTYDKYDGRNEKDERQDEMMGEGCGNK